ncbi:MAG TPA: hypothetical protein VNV42_12575 [Solirubrobacteraceae bacterium]|nr:hypothetical protein [Solirubrobacteraceae bacterium]
MVAPLCAAAVAVGALAHAQSVRAEAFGELGYAGEFGSGAGQFTYPTDLAVDSGNNDVYVLDEPGGEGPGPGPTSFRVQMFKSPLSPHQAPSGHVEVPTPVDGEGYPSFVANIAVDPVLHRLYVLKAAHTSGEESNKYAALEIDAYSTEPESGTGVLPPAPGVETEHQKGAFYKFPQMPTTGPPPATVLRYPDGMTVDPKTHSLILNGRDETGNMMVERVTTVAPYATGVPGGAFDDIHGSVLNRESAATGVAVGSNEEIFIVAHDLLAGKPAGELPGIAELTTTGDTNTLENPSVSVIDKFTAQEPLITGGEETFGAYGPGVQVALSSDGQTVYAVGVSKPQTNEEGSYVIRGFSTVGGAQQVVFGGGTTSCRIGSEHNAVAAGSNGIVYALDEGEAVFENGEVKPSPFGFRLIEFGPGGSECPTPSAEFDINKKPSSPTSTVAVNKGEPVKFEALKAALNSATPAEITWEVTGPEPFTITEVGAPAEDLKPLEKKFPKTGSYTVTLKIALKNGAYGNPPPVTGQFTVEPTAPKASFEVFASANLGEPLLPGQEIKAGEKVTLDASSSEDPNGSQTGEETHTLKSYRWEFGNGEVIEKKTEEASLTRSFSNSSPNALSEKVTLVVENEEGVKSPPNELRLIIQGTPSGSSGGGTSGSTTPPPSGTGPKQEGVNPPPGTGKQQQQPTKAKKLAKALKACKKLKSRSGRARCERQARRQYGPKAKKKGHKRK